MTAQLELTQKPFVELQIEALAQENQIKFKRVNKFIQELEERILSIEDIRYEKLINKTFRLPLVGRPNSLEDDYPSDFKFLPPKKLQVIGGFKTLTALKRTQCVDIVIEMPKNCIGHKDVKNQRYQHKRALYLAQLAHLLYGSVGWGLVERDKLAYRYFNGDPLKPVLLVTPVEGYLKADVIFQLFVTPDIEDSNIRLALLSPNHGNIAPKWFYKDNNFTTLDKNDELKTFIQGDSDAGPSPFYNSSVLFDIEAIANSEVITRHIINGTSISEALIITKIWLFQRDLHAHFSFIVSMFVSHLQTRQKIHQNMSSYQIFKVIVKSLVESNWSSGGLSYFDDHEADLPKFKSHFPIVFLSPSGRLNLCYNITVDTYNRLRHEAGVADGILSSMSSDIFEQIFTKRVDFKSKFDVIVHLPRCTKKILESVEYAQMIMDYGVLTPRLHSHNIISLIEKSMNDRIKLVQQDPKQLLMNKKWSFKGIAYDPTLEEQTLTFGLLLDAEKCLRIIDIGPEAQTKEADEFQQFWEPKTQLRLQNGVISETVVWHVDSFSQRRAIIKYILDHVMRKAQIYTVIAHCTQLERFINLKNVRFTWRDHHHMRIQRSGQDAKENQTKKKFPRDNKRKHSDEPKVVGKSIGTGEEVFFKVLNCYNDLNRMLRNISSMKHSITSIQPVSRHLRACGIFPPLPVSLQKRNKSLKRHKGVTMFPEKFDQVGEVLYIEPVEILLTLDSTSKWPGEFEAFEAEKLEYLINLGENLKAKEYTIKFAEDYLDVLHGQFVFRLRVRCQKELAVVALAKGKVELQRRRFEHEILPRVHGALDQLYKSQPAFSLTCRLVKRFISCQLFTDYISDTTIDLIVAHLFLHPEPFTEPASSTCGFKRFLQLVAEHDWKEAPLIINFDNQLKIDEIRRLRELVQEERSKYPPMIICTPFDRDRLSPWTNTAPSDNELEMLRPICSQKLGFLMHKVLSSQIINIKEFRNLFLPDFKRFHMIIKLYNRVVQTYSMSIDSAGDFSLSGSENNSSGPSGLKVMPIVDFNVVSQFVASLREKYDKIAWFFYDRYGQRLVGVIIKPGWEKILSKKDTIDQFISELKDLGSELVDEISLIKQKDQLHS